MALSGTRWMSILVFNLIPLSFAQSDPPSTPTPPECDIPYMDDEGMAVSKAIHCKWEPGPDPQTSTNYTLYWKSVSTVKQVKGSNRGGSIELDHITSHTYLSVWVQAENEHGKAISKVTSFNTADIIKRLAPNVYNHSTEPLQIHWHSQCSQDSQSEGTCEVRYRVEADQDWPEGEEGFHNIYSLEDPQPYTIYEFQVRCTCADHNRFSDWSQVYRVMSPEAAPDGELDIWTDCGIPSRSSECVLMWKKLQRTQARGEILGYEVIMSYNNTVKMTRVSVAEPKGQLLCLETQCYLISSLTGASNVSVLAYNAHGSTNPAYLVLPVPGEENSQGVYWKLDSKSLNVSWNVPFQFSDSLKEYVVQYKQVGLPPTQGFDWVRVNKSQTSISFTGQFGNTTAYIVSLFTVYHSGYRKLLKSEMALSVQGIPSEVPSFKVVSVGHTSVTLSWEPIPLHKRNGVIQYYEIGVNGQQVHNVSRLGENTLHIQDLHSAQQYVAWIRAVTEAGAGPNATAMFGTDTGFQHFSLILSLTIPLVLVFFCISLLCGLKKKLPKVPDPRHSLIVDLQINKQINNYWTCIPVIEHKISLVEVVQQTIVPNRATERARGEQYTQTVTWVDERVDTSLKEEMVRKKEGQVVSREDYSKIVDSDEDNSTHEECQCANVECDSLSLSGEDFSGYEKHFMPSDLEILNGVI